jgi:hypothetical protein
MMSEPKVSSNSVSDAVITRPHALHGESLPGPAHNFSVPEAWTRWRASNARMRSRRVASSIINGCASHVPNSESVMDSACGLTSITKRSLSSLRAQAVKHWRRRRPRRYGNSSVAGTNVAGDSLEIATTFVPDEADESATAPDNGKTCVAPRPCASMRRMPSTQCVCVTS